MVTTRRASRSSKKLEASHDTADAAPEDAVAKKQLLAHIDASQHKGNPFKSTWIACSTFVAMAATWASMRYVVHSPTLANSNMLRGLVLFALGAFWAMLVVRSFMIFHDCGHGSFFQGFKGARYINWLTCEVFAVCCGTPTDWNVGHQLHHANAGNMDQDDYDWSETIFHSRSSYEKLPAWKQRLVRIVRHPLFFFTFAGFATWYVKMRLPFEIRPGRKANYRFISKLVSMVFFVPRYYFAYQHGILPYILLGDYVAMTTGVALFHLQHVYNPAYAVGKDVWSRYGSAMDGSSLLYIPECLKWVTLGIEYHHIHHLRSRLPGYALRECFETSPKFHRDKMLPLMLKPAQMWQCLQYEVFDDVNQCYTTFSAL